MFEAKFPDIFNFHSMALLIFMIRRQGALAKFKELFFSGFYAPAQQNQATYFFLCSCIHITYYQLFHHTTLYTPKAMVSVATQTLATNTTQCAHDIKH